jgi:putative hydrolase of the HAD superfamily
VVFDLDDTLCDYRDAKARARLSVDALLAAAGIDSIRVWQHYDRVEPLLFAEMTKGAINVEEYRLRRYRDCFVECGIGDVLAASLSAEANQCYMRVANQEISLFPEVVDILGQLRAHGFRLGILTNGPSGGQRSKLRALGLDKMVDVAQISEEAGIAKPSPAAYLRIAAALGVTSDEALMVGDSMEGDIEGAVAAGFSAVLIDRHDRFAGMSVARLRDLSGLSDLLGAGG